MNHIVVKDNNGNDVKYDKYDNDELNQLNFIRITPKELYVYSNDEVLYSIISNGRFRHLMAGKLKTYGLVSSDNNTIIGVRNSIFITSDHTFRKREKIKDKITSVFFSEPIALELKRNSINPSNFFEKEREETIKLLEQKLDKKLHTKYVMDEDGLLAIFVDIYN